MTALSLSTIVLTLLGVVPGETTGWGTDAVRFQAYVNNNEHQEIYPVCGGQYTAEVLVERILDDPSGLLEYVTRIDICYDQHLDLVSGDIIEVRGVYYSGACPLVFCGRVDAAWVEKIDDVDDPEEPGDPNGIYPPDIITGAAEATERTATLQAILFKDGGAPCRARFTYRAVESRSWNTEWIEDLKSGDAFSQKIAGLIPGTRYYYSVEAENLAGWSGGYGGSFVTPQETVPPIPDPTIWVIEPDQVDGSSITMMAHVARDLAGPEEYLFDFVASPTGGPGGSDSPWQYSPEYLDLGLTANHQYGYRVKARDEHGNETAYSTTEYAFTDIETPTGVTFGEITTNSIQVKSSGTLSGLNRGQSGLKLENVTAGQASGWQRDNSFWTSDGLLPNTSYTFRARARNGDGEFTPLSSEARICTLANAPTAATFSNVAVKQLFVQWGANGNPVGTQYWCQNTVTNANSGWITGTQWLDTSLAANVRYSYRVKARNGDGVETAFSAIINCYSAVETPTGVTFGTITPNSIQVKSANTPSGLNQGSSGLQLENTTTSQVSPWRQDNSFWTSDSLLPNHNYGFRIGARNGDMVQTPYSETVYTCTYANVPTKVAFSGVTTTSIQVQWGTNGNPSNTLYLCENTTAGTNSGWTTDATWNNTGLLPNTRYTYRVKALNGNGVETAWVDLGTQSTDYRSLTISATAGGKVTAPGQDVFRYPPGAVVNLLAAPQAGYHFLCWTGSAVDGGRVADANAAETTVLVDAHYTLVANFLRTQIYVDSRAVGAQNGSSWQNAYASFQDALDAAQRGNEIRVAQGTYRPDAGTSVLPGDRLATFVLKQGVAVKGGYAGLGNADPNVREITVYETVLSGDLKRDDRKVSGPFDLYTDFLRTDNSLHVVSARDVDDTTLLEGVTILGGNSTEGAGLHLVCSRPRIVQCTFRANRAGQLSGDGTAGWGSGAGVSCYQSAPTFTQCSFRSNWAGGQGGGLYSVESQPTLKNCLFRDNEAGLQGGAIYGEDSNSVLVGCAFHANWSWDGGALYNDEGCDSRITNCQFLGNAGQGSGGAIFDTGKGLEASNCVFAGNLAFSDGGGVLCALAPGVLTNCTFNRNIGKTGQAVAVRQTIVSLANCILWDHERTTMQQIALLGVSGHPAEVIVAYCDVLAGAEGIFSKGPKDITWGAGNINIDPRFLNPAGADKVAGTLDDDLRLRSGSPCVDAGDNTVVLPDTDDLNSNGDRLERLPWDLDGRPRFTDDPGTADTGAADAPSYKSIVDLGAYEL